MAQDYFSGGDLRGNLKRRSVRSGAVTMAAQATNAGLYALSMVFFMQLLGTSNMGMVTEVLVITGFASQFKDLGLSAATIQRRDITQEQVSGLFWINVAVGVTLTSLVAASAPFVALFYGDPSMVKLTTILGIVFIFSGLGGQHQALLVRQHQFRRIAIVTVVSQVCGIAAGLAVAFVRRDYWALVWVQLTTAATATAGLWLASGWRPSLTYNEENLRSLVAFGGRVTGYNVANYLARNLDNALIGRRWGKPAVGVYSLAYRLLTFPLIQINAPLASVAVPTLSRMRDDPGRYRRFYLQAVSWIAFITLPGIMFMIVYSKPVMTVVTLGRKEWSEVGNIFMIMGIAGLLQPITSTANWLYLSRGRGLGLLRWGVASAALIIVSFFVGLPYGAIGVATAYTVASLIQAVPCMIFATMGTPVTMGALARKLWPILAATLAAGGAAAVLRWGMPQFTQAMHSAVAAHAAHAIRSSAPAFLVKKVDLASSLVATAADAVLGFVVTAAVYVGASCALAGGTQPLREAKSLVSELFGKGRAAAPASPAADPADPAQGGGVS